MNRVFIQRIAEERDRERDPTRLFVKTTLIMAALSLPAFLLIIAFGPELFSFFFGGKWHRAGEYARWMSLFSFAFLCALPARSMTAVYELQRVYAIVESVRALLGAVFIAAAAELTKDDVTAVAAFSVLQLAVMAIFIPVVLISFAGSTSWRSNLPAQSTWCRQRSKPRASVDPLVEEEDARAANRIRLTRHLPA